MLPVLPLAVLPLLERLSTNVTKIKVLVVSEDPEFIVDLNEKCRGGPTVLGCLGPSHGPCPLLEHDRCGLAARSDVILVDSPPDGRFTYHTTSITAGEYAERLQRTYPNRYVVLCNAKEGVAGPTGEVTVVEDRASGLELLNRIVAALSIAGPIGEEIEDATT